eukprot:scaffold1690_cov177-Ochromonas_danica.AAC.23
MVKSLVVSRGGSLGDFSSQPRLSLARNTPPPTPTPSIDYSRVIKSVWSTLLASAWLCSQTMSPLPVWAGDLPQAAVVASASTTFTASDTSSSSNDATSSNTVVDPQTIVIDAQRQVMDSSLRKDYVSGSQVAKAIVSLVSTKSPKGLEDGTLVDPSFDNPNAALICTAIGKHESPVAAKKFHLQGLRFPVFLELSVNDLMQPHTVESWLTSSLSQDNIAVTCIIDPDGKLATPEVSDRYGFGISDLDEPEEVVEENEVAEVSTKTVVKQQEEKQINRKEEAKAEAEEERPLTREAVHINLNFRSDGRPYSETEMQLMEKIDAELERLGFSKQLGVAPIVKPPPTVATAAAASGVE